MFDVIPSLDLKFLVGLDGLSLMMVLLTAIVTMSAVWVTPKVDHGENAFYSRACSSSRRARSGAFISFDLFFFYAFHELALIPTFLLIGIWGHGENRVAAAWKITIYLAVGQFRVVAGPDRPVRQPPGERAHVRPDQAATPGHACRTSWGWPARSSPVAQIWIFPLLLDRFRHVDLAVSRSTPGRPRRTPPRRRPPR